LSERPFPPSDCDLLRLLTHSVRRYSICPFTERKSSSAHAAISFQRVGDRRSSTCFLSLSLFLSMASIKASAIDYRLSVSVAAEDNQQVADHGRLSLLIKVNDVVLAEFVEGHLDHSHRAIHYHLSGCDDG
jgi:hypothetical protein